MLLSGFYASANFPQYRDENLLGVLSDEASPMTSTLAGGNRDYSWPVGSLRLLHLLLSFDSFLCLGDFLILVQLSVLSKNKTNTPQDETFANFWRFLYSYLDSANTIPLWALQIFNSDFCIHGDHKCSVWVSSPFAMAGGLSLGSKMEQL